MIRILLAIALWMAAAQSCAAGAWMRAEGEGFLSLGLRAFEDRADATRRFEQNFYVDYGFRPRLTLGAYGNYTPGQKGDGQLFLRIPVRNDDRPAKVGAELGIGAESEDGSTFDPFVRTGLAWGRGLTIAGRGGWVAVDSAVQWYSGDKPALFKIDTTAGFSLSERLQVMGQVFFEADENGESLTLIPSVIYAPRRGDMRYVVGFEQKTGRDESTGLKFAIWREF